MEQKSCLNCEFSSHIYMNIDDPTNALFFCEKTQEIMNNIMFCSGYQKKSRLND